MYRLLEEGKPSPLIAGNSNDYEQLLDYVFVQRPFMPGAVKKHLVQQAIEHQLLNSRIFQQLADSRNVAPLEVLLSSLKVPTLIVWGAGDRVLHPSGAAVLKGVMPKAEAVVMDGAGHLPMIEKPKETAELYLGFILNQS